MVHGALLPMVILATILYNRGGVQNLASYYPIVESDGKNDCIHPPDNSRRYFVTQFLVEDGVPRLIIWHHHEHGLHLVHEWSKEFGDIWDPWKYDFLN
jgi:hypothetical protein